MAIKIQSYYKTTEMDEAQLKNALLACRNQDYEILQLFKTYGHLTDHDVYDLYTELIGPIIKTSASRSRITLLQNNAIIPHSQIQGPYGRPVILWSIADNIPSIIKPLKRLPKTIKIEIPYTEEMKIDLDIVYDNLAKQLVFLTNKFKI